MSRSAFPEGVDHFPELFDLPYDKFVAAERYTTLKMQAKLSNDEQNELMVLTTELKDYIISPESFNHLTDAMTALQQFFNENVHGWLENKQQLWDTYIRNFKLVGQWQTGTEYKFQNMVVESGNLYLAKSDHTSTSGNKPVIGSNGIWQQISNKGDKGDVGLTGILKGDWNASTTYTTGDAVSFERELHYTPLVYIALRANTGKNPKDNPLDWMLYDKIYAGTKIPNGYGVGMHFIEFQD